MSSRESLPVIPREKYSLIPAPSPSWRVPSELSPPPHHTTSLSRREVPAVQALLLAQLGQISTLRTQLKAQFELCSTCCGCIGVKSKTYLRNYLMWPVYLQNNCLCKIRSPAPDSSLRWSFASSSPLQPCGNGYGHTHTGIAHYIADINYLNNNSHIRKKREKI